MTNKFTIQIGDWTGDGHGYHEDYVIASNKPVQDVREAYFAAVKKFPSASPEKIAKEWKDSRLDNTMKAATENLGYVWNTVYPTQNRLLPKELLAYLLWYIRLGDPSLDLQIHTEETFSFIGYDNQGRHIGFIGYGLFA